MHLQIVSPLASVQKSRPKFEKMKVEISTHVHLLLSSYALSNETQEICCVLLGSKSEYIRVTQVVFTIRKQKKKDRVEISSEQLSIALVEADKLGLQVVGWMHSHPKITVQPSHVDLKTQLSFQQLDPTFIGLIYSCFHETKSSSQKLSVICFQTKDFTEELNIPFVIVPSKVKDLDMFKRLQDIIKTYFVEELLEDFRDPVSAGCVGTNILKIQRNLIFPLLHHFGHFK
jgi:BRCA1/BRCA2-containing complex subunit 3